MLKRKTSFLVTCLALLTEAAATVDSCFKDPWLQKANYSTCPGNKFTLDIVDISTTYHTKLHRHVLFKNDVVSFCISGKATGVPGDVLYLQNSVHGSVRVKLDIPLLGNVLDQGINTPFCDIDKDGCTQLTPACGSIKPGVALVKDQEFCYCSTLQVPSWAPDNVDDVLVTWKILGTSEPPLDCEEAFDFNALRAQRKEVLACMTVPAMLRPERRNPKLRKGAKPPPRRRRPAQQQHQQPNVVAQRQKREEGPPPRRSLPQKPRRGLPRGQRPCRTASSGDSSLPPCPRKPKPRLPFPPPAGR